MNFEQKKKDLQDEFNQLNIGLVNLDSGYKAQRDDITRRISEVQGKFSLIEEIEKEEGNGNNPDKPDKKK